MRRYYDSREDILLRLAAGEWPAWAADVTGRLASRRPPLRSDRLARQLAESVAARPRATSSPP